MSRRRIVTVACLLAVVAGAAPARATTSGPVEASRAERRAALFDLLQEGREDVPASPAEAGAPGVAAVVPPATTDRVHLVDSVGEPKVLDAAGDLTSATYDLSVPEVATFAVTLRRGQDLATTPAWKDGRSSVVWGIDDDGDGGEDVYAFAYSLSDGRVLGEIVNAADQTWRCGGVVRWDGAQRLSLSVPSSCVTTADSRVYAFVYYDPTPSDPAGVLSTDWAPEAQRWSAPVLRRAAAAPARPATSDGTTFTIGSALFAGTPARGVTLLAGGDRGLLCDTDGDGVRSPVTFSSGRWATHRPGAVQPDQRFLFGEAGDVPVCGDWDGDGTETAGVFRDGTWLLRGSVPGAPATVLAYGTVGDTPVAGDWDGDGVDTPGVRRGVRWYLWEPDGDVRFDHGIATHVPVVGDWDGDGDDTVGLVRADASGDVWNVRNTHGSGRADWTWRFGRTPGTRPVVAR